MNMGHAQLFQMVQAARRAARRLRARLHHAEVLSAVTVSDAGIFVDGKVADMRLVQHGIRVVFQNDEMILVPALGIGFLRVINQRPAGVGRTAAGVRIVDTINRRRHDPAGKNVTSYK